MQIFKKKKKEVKYKVLRRGTKKIENVSLNELPGRHEKEVLRAAHINYPFSGECPPPDFIS